MLPDSQNSRPKPSSTALLGPPSMALYITVARLVTRMAGTELAHRIELTRTVPPPTDRARSRTSQPRRSSMAQLRHPLSRLQVPHGSQCASETHKARPSRSASTRE